MRTILIASFIFAFAGAGFAASLDQTLTFQPSAYRLVQERGFTRILSRTATPTREVGRPELPEKPVYVLLPPGTRVTGLHVLEAQEQTVPGSFNIYPKQKDVPSTVKAVWTGPDPGAYASSAVYPQEVAKLVGQGDYQGQRLAFLLVYPYRYQAREGRLSFVSRVRIELELEPEDHPPLSRKREFTEDRMLREGVLRTLADNSEALGAYPRPLEVSGWNYAHGFAPTDEPSPTGSPVQYVIITNDALAPAFQTLADYKTQVGTPTVVRTMTWIKAHYPHGVDDAETVRNFLKDAYQNWGTSSVLLGGDVEEVPIRFIQWGGWSPPMVLPSDYYYQCLDGSWDWNRNGIYGEAYGDSVDLLPELMAGRASVRDSTEARVFVNKTLNYFAPQDRFYQTRALLLGQCVYWPGDGAAWCDYIASFFPPEFEVKKLYEYDFGQGNMSKDTVIYHLNKGYGVIYSQTHGQATEIGLQRPDVLYREDLDNLVNGTRTGFWYAVNCFGNALNLDCLGEHFLRNPNGGGIGFYGSTGDNFPDNGIVMDGTFFDSLFQAGHLRVGQAANDSKIAFVGSAGGETIYRLLIMTYLLEGDPDLAIWATTPKTLSLDFPGTVALGPVSFRVRVSSLLGPVSGVRVTATKPGEVYASGFTDNNGEVLFSFVPQSQGVITVAAKRDNFLVQNGTVSVVPQSPFVTSYRQRVEDDTSGVSSGNGNGVLEAGETIALWLSLKNTGGALAQGLHTTLRTQDSNVTLLDSTFAIPGPLAAGDTFVSSIPLRLRLSAAMPDGRTLAFTLVTRDTSSRTFTQTLKFDGRAPALAQIGQSLDGDTLPPTPGKTVGLVLRIKNYGGGQDEGVTARLSSQDTLVAIVDSIAQIGRIPAYGEHLTGPGEEVRFKVTKARIGGGYTFHLRLQDSYGRNRDRNFELLPIAAPGPLWDGPDSAAITLHWNPPDTTYRYNLYRANSSGGPYTRVNPDPVRSARFTDDGLVRGSPTYYYVTTAVDTSLNESRYSPELAAATYPSYHAGWPREMPTQILATPVVCDLDMAYPGKEVIAATLDNQIYAWHADGTGVLNSDGLFKTVNNAKFFVTSPAAGDLDGDRRPEIVESTFGGTPRVYVWKADGSDLPGWPRSLSGNCHASPVLYDLDGDGWPEVIAATMSGNIYVFRHDGTGYRDTSGLFVTVADSPGVLIKGTPAVGDIDGDGRPEIVVSAGNIYLFAVCWDGTPEPNFPVRLSSVVTTSPALAKLDATTPGLQIVVLTSDNLVHVLRSDGQETAGWPQPVQVSGDGSSPAIGDLDRDGKPEVVVAGDNQVYAFKADGSMLPGFPVTWAGTSFSSPTVGDLNGDGRMEIIIGGLDLRAYAWHADGSKVLGFPIQTSGSYLSSPTLSDLGDGRVTALLGCYDYFMYAWEDMPQPGPINLEWWTFHHDEWRTGQYGFLPKLGVEQGPNTGIPLLVPKVTALYQSLPNPMTASAAIHYDLAKEAQVRLAVYNVAGERVRTLSEDRMKPGRYTAAWDGRDEKGAKVGSGVYFYRLEAGEYLNTKKLVVMK